MQRNLKKLIPYGCGVLILFGLYVFFRKTEDTTANLISNIRVTTHPKELNFISFEKEESVSESSDKQIPHQDKMKLPLNEISESYMTEDLQKLKNMPTKNMADVEYRYFNVTYHDDGKCGTDYKYYGPKGDGGYHFCLSEPYNFKRGQCIVYDFGIKNLWQFDEEIVKEHNCQIYSFDPTMKVGDHKRGDNINFYSVGISGTLDDKRWPRVMNLKEVQKFLNHSQTVIDLVKIDIEWSEWDLFDTAIEDGSFKNIKQIVYESHINFTDETFEDYVKRANILIKLRKSGMKQWYHRDNQWLTNIKRSKNTNLKRNCCVEHCMINTNFQK